MFLSGTGTGIVENEMFTFVHFQLEYLMMSRNKRKGGHIMKSQPGAWCLRQNSRGISVVKWKLIIVLLQIFSE